MYAKINASSSSIRAEVRDLILSGMDATEAVARVMADRKAAIAIKMADTVAKRAIFNYEVAENVQHVAPADLILAVKREYEARMFKRSTLRAEYKARGEKLDAETLAAALPRYSSFAAMSVSRAWAKAQWIVGACYAKAETLDAIRSAL